MSRNFELLQRAGQEDFFTPSGTGMPIEPMPAPAPPVHKPEANEEISKLVQRLFLHGGQKSGPRVVSFSGVTRDDRSSWICACAGESLASQTDSSVCLVDANIWSPRLHDHFRASNQSGLADALTTAGPVRHFGVPISIGNLWLVPSGLAKGSFYTRIEAFQARFAELREEFDYVLVSAPALAREAEATSIGQLADGIVLIVEANQTRRATLRQAKERMEAARVQLLGAVLDQRTFPIPEFLYRKF